MDGDFFGVVNAREEVAGRYRAVGIGVYKDGVDVEYEIGYNW